MARYIDADKLREEAFYADTEADIVNYIRNYGFADIVSRAEVEKLREINNSLLEAGQEWQKRYENLAREIFEEIEKLSYRFMNDKHYIFGDMVWDIAELKKKYTEGGVE